MNHPLKTFLLAGACILASASFARADYFTVDLNGSTRAALHELGKDFTIGCAILGVSYMIGAVISRKK